MKKINKLLAMLGAGSASIIAPLSVIGMKMNSETNKVELFDNIFAKKYTLNLSKKDNGDIISLFYENKKEIYHLDGIYDIVKIEDDVTIEDVKDYKITVIGVEKKPYDPNVWKPELLRIAFDIEDLNSKRHWGFTIKSSSAEFYTENTSVYSKLFRYLSYKINMQSEWYKSLPDDNSTRVRYETYAKKYKSDFDELFFKSEKNDFDDLKSFLINVQNGKEKLSDKLEQYNIEKKLDLFQFFNKGNVLDFSVSQKKVLDQNNFYYNTRIKGIINPLDILKNKNIYKSYIEDKLKQNNKTIDYNLIDLNKNIDIKIKKVVIIPEFQLDGDWDINYKAELSGSILGKPIIIPSKKIGILNKTKTSHNQDIFTYLERAGELINVKADRSNLFPLKNDYQDYDSIKNSITQKTMKELFKRSTFTIDQDYDITNLQKDIVLDLSMKNSILHDKNKRFNITIKGLSIGFQYEASIKGDIEVSGVTYLLK